VAQTDIATTSKGWFLGLGIFLIVVGVLAILFPLVFTLTAQVLVGLAMLASGIAVLIHAFKETTWSGFLWELLVGALYTFAGLYFIFDPLGGMIAFTLALAACFIVDGIFRIVMGVKARPHNGALWAIIGGVISIILGVLIWSELPGSASWVVGTLIGINLLFAGGTFVALGTSTFAPK
jgi:uncharacterized membrane protein HdeD (DUF308 family)